MVKATKRTGSHSMRKIDVAPKYPIMVPLRHAQTIDQRVHRGLPLWRPYFPVVFMYPSLFLRQCQPSDERALLDDLVYFGTSGEVARVDCMGIDS